LDHWPRSNRPASLGPYAAGASRNKRFDIGGRAGLVDSATEKNKARAVVERSVFI